jgi:RNA polymerase sigma-70 factor (ECF subfamily)
VVALPRDSASRTDAINWSQVDDLTLAHRVASDRACFGILYDRYVDRIYGFCLNRLQDREAAEDATSQTFLKALAALHSKPPRGGSIKSFLFTIAWHVIVDGYRTQSTIPLTDASDRPEPDGGPEDRALHSERGRELRDLARQLSPDQQDVIYLRLADLSDQEIADVLGKGHGAIRSLQHRAVKQLRALYTQQNPESGESQ